MTKIFLSILLLITILSCTKTVVEYARPVPILSTDIIINKDTIINNTWIIPATTIIRFQTGGRISGIGTIQGGIIDAAITQNIFDTTINLVNIALYNRDFSVMWYGASPTMVDNYNHLQKSINVCITNRLPCFIPKGVYNYSKGLEVKYIYKGAYVGVALHLYGESQYWDDKTTLVYSGVGGFGLGIQVGKGTEIDHLKIVGQFKPPINDGVAYYSTPLESYGSSTLSYGIVIDWDGTKNVGGSTGVIIHDMWVTNFQVLYSVSPNGVTFNGDNLIFENIRGGNARIMFQNGQAQEKGNIIRNIYCWEPVHTLIQMGRSGKFQAGQYTVDGGNIAGGCIRLFDISEAGWYPTHISNLFSESIGTIGTIYAGNSVGSVPTSVDNCVFHFVPIPQAGIRSLLSCNSQHIQFTACLFRYYGDYTTPLQMSGYATFTNCSFSGPINNTGGAFIIN